MTSVEQFRPAGLIAPHWEVRIAGKWRLVDMVIETETPSGARRVWMYFVGFPLAVGADKEELVMSRPPKPQKEST